MTDAAKKKDKATLDAIFRASEAEAIERYATMGDDEVDAELRAGGIDPVALRAEGDALGAKLAAQRERLAWKEPAAEELARARKIVRDVQSRRTRLPRAEMLARLTAAKSDSRFSGQLAAMFRKRTAEESTDDELAQLLEEIEILAELDPKDAKKG